MNCTHIESLLAAFTAGDLSEAEATEVRAHVDTCDACRVSLAAYEALESTLRMRSSLVPSVDRFIPNIADLTQTAASGVAAYARARKWLDRLLSAPAMATIGFLMVGMATFFYNDKISAAIDRGLSAPPTPLFHSLDSVVTSWSHAMTNPIILASVCAGVTILSLLSTGVATAKLLKN